ncbi:hypothetical protein Zmor_001319 [Zophobas morio]|uniref:Uncharacterized protein n=1 Tax=Zophobas morio TaxID=2755281 RepID=A0AA38IYC9_9CUCU|nr:hypothetical protein Zmor_001319 [Zophobas morio]
MKSLRLNALALPGSKVFPEERKDVLFTTPSSPTPIQSNTGLCLPRGYFVQVVLYDERYLQMTPIMGIAAVKFPTTSKVHQASNCQSRLLATLTFPGPYLFQYVNR